MRALATAALVLLAQPALALSCLAPNAARTFNDLVEAPEVYVLVVGTFTAPDGLPSLPEGEGGTAQMVLTGGVVTETGLNPVSTPVTVTTECAGVWCASFPTDGRAHLAFLERSAAPAPPRLTVSPCPYRLLAAPTAQQMPALHLCMTQGTCSPNEISAFEPE